MLNKRQQKILDYINQNKIAKRIEIQEYISTVDDKASRITVIRDLDFLLKNHFIERFGSARSISYKSLNKKNLLRHYEVEDYFKIEVDERNILYPYFNFDIFNQINSLLTPTEIENLEKTNNIYKQKINNLPTNLLKKEFERLLIELSWKSSQIEGNTYSLLDTENLLKNNLEAIGHKKEEAIMLLNHKKALEFIFENKDYYKELSLKKIEELHELLTFNMNVSKGLRKNPVGIAGTNYKPLFNQHQIREAMEKLINLINSTENIIEKALITVLMISYIQPFEDGNKRTGRILANAILFSNDHCPLSYRSVNEVEYKKAVLLFYENNSLAYFKKLFIEQFNFAVEKYF